MPDHWGIFEGQRRGCCADDSEDTGHAAYQGLKSLRPPLIVAIGGLMSYRFIRTVLVICFAGSIVSSALRAAEDQVKPSPKPIVAVFSLDAGVSETPLDESFALFSQPSVSLKDLTARMRK